MIGNQTVNLLFANVRKMRSIFRKNALQVTEECSPFFGHLQILSLSVCNESSFVETILHFIEETYSIFHIYLFLGIVEFLGFNYFCIL